MKIIKNYMLSGAIFVSILGTLFHFVYAWSNNNPVIGLFTPINESTWEHMKLIFFPMLLFSFYVTKKTETSYPCVNSSILFSTLLGTILIPVLFYTYSGILGYNITFIDISIYFISVVLAFFTAYKLTLSCRVKKYSVLLNVLIFLLVVGFFFFTTFPPNIQIFANP